MSTLTFARALKAALVLGLLISPLADAQPTSNDWAAFRTANQEAERTKSSLVGRQIFVTAHDAVENECLEFIAEDLKADLRKKLNGKSYLLFRYAVMNHDSPSFDFCIFINRKDASLIAVEGY